ncbi:hypothetical protein ACNQGP_15205 [Flavobacterium sp. GT2N3]|uniref:hypothetical protein n=1 Tax=unclassified Flavobacterium TaxID=196869 RepID=UPI003AAB7ED7
MKILGYSERGIINSLIFSIGDDNELMGKFIGLMNLPETFDLGEPINYTILLEQSFSEFGDADLVIITHYKNPKEEKPEDKKVLFIEGKVKTLKSNWNINTQYKNHIQLNKDEIIQKPTNYWSNLFSQLYLKKLLITNLDEIKIEKLKETNFTGKRQIGSHKIVLNAFQMIECEEAYYVGIIPSTVNEIKDFTAINQTGYYFISWKTVHDFCKKEEKLNKVLDVFDYNEGQIYKYDELI